MSVVLNPGLDQGQHPAGAQVQHENQPREEGFAAVGDKGSEYDAVVGEQGTVGAHEKNLADPKLGGVFVPDRRSLADAEAAPEDAEDVHPEEDKQPRLDGNLHPREQIHPCECPNTGRNDADQGENGKSSRAEADTGCLKEEGRKDWDVVEPGCIPQRPACAELERLRVRREGTC